MLRSLPTYETTFEQAKRHVVQFQRIVAGLEVIVARMDISRYERSDGTRPFGNLPTLA
jgi:hypothetical protein